MKKKRKKNKNKKKERKKERKDRAAQLSVFKLAFISASEIWPFLVLYLEGSRGINVALILFILLNNNQAFNNLHTYKDRNETSATFTPDYSYVGTRK